jgi:hypothetical protein
MYTLKKTLLILISFILLTASNSFWKDRNTQSTSSVDGNVTQGSGGAEPTLTDDVVQNKLPGMVFDGATSFFNFNSGDDLINSPFTVMVVEQRADDSADNYFVGSNGGGGLLTWL